MLRLFFTVDIGLQDIDTADHTGATPLLFAAKYGWYKAVDLLLRMVSYVDDRKDDGETALHIAAERGDMPTALVLIRARAGVDVESETGQTPLHRAVERGHIEVAALLLDAGASAWVVDRRGHSPATLALWLAAPLRHPRCPREIVRLFVKCGCLESHD